MATNIRSLSVFIASPSDVSSEREIAEDVIRKVDETLRAMFETSLEVNRWEKEPPLTQPLTRASIQEVINEKVKRCDIFILILNKRIGSREDGFDDPNTKREIDIIVERVDRADTVMMLTYFKRLKDNEDPGSQEREVRELRQTLERNRIWYSNYDATDDFKEQLTHHIYQTALKLLWETTKQKATRHFWQLGEAERKPSTKLAVVYPPIDRSYTEKQEPDLYWLNRLAPNVVYEDHRALQKIQKSLSFTGLRDYRIYTTSDIPRDIKYMNRAWVCLPRNPRALSYLKLYQKEGRCRFSIVPRKNKAAARIDWNGDDGSGQRIAVKSPLDTYLRLQRDGRMSGGEWTASMGRIVAKDFAILARFRDQRSQVEIRLGYLYDYFLAGIRGLGTWGAGWYLDRRSKSLLQYDPSSDIQLLLEITFVGGRILDVVDVSTMPEAYFRSANRAATIRSNIKRFSDAG